MPMFPSKRLRCFYCGSLSAQKKREQIRSFHCPQCEAVNHLDRNGQITDPPAQSTASPSTPAAPRYAQAAPLRSSSPPPSSFTTSSESIFCATCIKNQHFLRESLAVYQPPEHLSQPAQAAAQKDYQQKLEQRYPQVCATCAPKARERIRRAGYVAKTDHLRRMMQRTKERAYSSVGWNWDIVLRLGGLGWWASVIAQVIWHALSAHALWEKKKSQEMGLGYEDQLDLSNLQPSFRVCVAAVMTGEKGTDACAAAISSWMPWILSLALITFLWNNQLWNKYLGFGGRMVGLRDYYLIQLVLFASRTVAWSFLEDPRGLERWIRGLDIAVGVHMAMAGFIIMGTLVSASVVKLDNSPLVSFQLRPDQILPDVPTTQASPSPERSTAQQPPATISAAAQTRTPFRIELLAPNANIPPTTPIPSAFQTQPYQNPQPIQSPTPPHSPPRGQDPDAMDWSPSVHSSFNTNSAIGSSFTSESQQPFTASSFHKSPTASTHNYNLRARTPPSRRQRTPLAPLLNAAPIPPAPNTRMRHPRAPAPQSAQQPTNPFLQQANQRNSGSLFTPYQAQGNRSGRRNSLASTVTDAPTEVSTAFDDDDENIAPHTAPHGRAKWGGKTAKYVDLAPPRLFLEKDRADTGLEGMFDEVFRLGSASNKRSSRRRRKENMVREREQGERRGAGIFGVEDEGDDLEQEVEGEGGRGDGRGWLKVGGVLGALLVPGTILGMAVLGVKGL